MDRQGRMQALGAGLGNFRYPRFSPDARRLAFGTSNTGVVGGDVWVYSMDAGSVVRLTADTASGNPEWDPDGRSIVYVHWLRGVAQLFRVSADGSGTPVLVLSRPNDIFESHITPDRRTIVFREDAGASRSDVLMAPLDSPQAVQPLLTSNFDERNLGLSPDGRWLAYVSNETGTNEVYVRKPQATSARWRVSPNGGIEPRWARTGELFFRARDPVFVSRVELGAEPRVGAPRGLFAGQFESSVNEPLWDVSPDGTRFVMVRTVAGGEAGRIGLFLNWVDHWRARQK